MKIKAFALILIFLAESFPSFSVSPTRPVDENKGLFILQFSWDLDTFKDNIFIKVYYEKSSTLNKIRAGSEVTNAIKNQFLVLELKAGEYDFISFDLTGGDIPYGKRLIIDMDKPFLIEAGKVTNGGMIFLTRENKETNQVFTISINNQAAVERYVDTYQKSYVGSIQPAWSFVENEKVDKIIETYAATLVARENANPRPNVKYMFTSLGMLISMERDGEGKVTSYELAPTNTYQQITKVSIKNGKLLCTLGNGDFIYGPPENLQYIPFPSRLNGLPFFKMYGDNKFILYDKVLNIYSSDERFNWKEQTELARDGSNYMSSPSIYFGSRNMYLFTSGLASDNRLLQSSYDDIQFKEIQLTKDIKEVKMVTETKNKIIIGPRLRSVIKKPAELYVSEDNGSTWTIVELPRGDCNRFAPYKEDENHFYVECWKENQKYESFDGGQTWKEIKD